MTQERFSDSFFNEQKPNNQPLDTIAREGFTFGILLPGTPEHTAAYEAAIEDGESWPYWRRR